MSMAMERAASARISVVIPVFNEEASLEALIARCLRTCRSMRRPFEVILVDDGSRDASAAMIAAAADRHPGEILGLMLNRNYGQHAAIMAGFAETRGGNMVTLDSDLQNPPEEIPRLVAKLEEGFDVVGSVRVPRRDPLLRRISSALTNKLVRASTGVMMHDYGCMLRAYRRQIVDAMLVCREQCTFIPVLANSLARETTEIEVAHAKRAAGGSKYGLWRLINLNFDLLTSMTTFPLRLLSVLGTLVSLAGVGFGLLLLVLRWIHGPAWAAEGVFTLFAALFIFIGAQFIGMGLLGEYVGRIHREARGRPLYLVREIAGRNRRSEERPVRCLHAGEAP
jgi:undecaprenyl-phosphate 4-deoxy-4-formamido-L-arabinose transferase